MSNVVAFRTNKKQIVKRWSPEPANYYSFNMTGEVSGTGQAVAMIVPVKHFEEYQDIPTWNLMWAFYQPYGKETNDEGEISYSALNPRAHAVEKLTRITVGSKSIRDWMVTEGPKEVIEMLLKACGKALPFPAKSVEELRERAYRRVAHLEVEET